MSPSILQYAKDLGIPTFDIKTPNSKKFIEEVRKLAPDVIINQSQNIIKKELLNLPAKGVLNRHNALLPKNRGRLTPFWVLYKKEPETGVSIHYVEEGLDSGDIVVQERFAVPPNASFNDIVKKNFEIAPKAMLKALDKLEHGNFDPIPNDDDQATYNSIPTFKEALQFRLRRII